ncbi:MAG: helix-turn-helix transcriptional regulator [Bacteroidota bacterium]
MLPILTLHSDFNLTVCISPLRTISHYLGRVDIFEFQLKKGEVLSINSTEGCFFLLVDIRNNNCSLGFHFSGHDPMPFNPGMHQVILITYCEDWFIYKCSFLPEINTLVGAVSKQESLFLPSIRMAKGLLRAVRKSSDLNDLIKRDRAIYLFLNDSINEYHRRLKLQISTSTYSKQKAAAIAQFVQENYALEIVEDRRKLADRFMVSERHLDRLAKSAFGIPLHAQVIKFRMQFSLDQLINANKPIYEIAEKSGYREPYYFSRAFKNCFGFPPSSLTTI